MRNSTRIFSPGPLGIALFTIAILLLFGTVSCANFPIYETQSPVHVYMADSENGRLLMKANFDNYDDTPAVVIVNCSGIVDAQIMDVRKKQIVWSEKIEIVQPRQTCRTIEGLPAGDYRVHIKWTHSKGSVVESSPFSIKKCHYTPTIH